MALPKSAVQQNKIFIEKKARILESLNAPIDSYTDASPKGSIDESIRPLIELINNSENYVTTSSCAGRIAVFLEGVARVAQSRQTLGRPAHYVEQETAGDDSAITNSSDTRQTAAAQTHETIGAVNSSSGKGSGGRWLFVAHSKIDLDRYSKSLSRLLGLEHMCGPDTQLLLDMHGSRFVHFKFEPMILHVLTASISTAQTLLTAALQAGFRESGATGLGSSCPMVAIRCHGLALDCIVGYSGRDGATSLTCSESVTSLVSDAHLQTLARIANDRFEQNLKRMKRLEYSFSALEDSSDSSVNFIARRKPVEDRQLRRSLKHKEGLRRQQHIRETQQAPPQKDQDVDEGEPETMSNNMDQLFEQDPVHS